MKMPARLTTLLAVLVTLFLVVSLTGCAPDEDVDEPTDPEMVKGGTLRLVQASDPTSLDVHRTPSWGMIHILLHVTGFEEGYSGDLYPWMFEAYEVRADGLELHVTLREGITMHDGSPLDAELFAWNYERLWEHGPHATLTLGTFDRVEAVGERDAVIYFTEPFAPIFRGLSFAYSGVQSRAAIEQYGDEYGHSNVVGAGPFIFERWDAGDTIILVRNEDYAWPPEYYENQGPSYFERIEYYTMPDETTRLLALENNEVDIVALPTHAVDDMIAHPDIEVHEYTTHSLGYLGINCSKEPWSDPMLRKAVAHTLDRETMVRVALDGRAVVNPTFLSPSVFGHDPTLFANAYPEDIDRAKELLEEAGWTDTTGDGWVNDAGGNPLVMNIWTYNHSHWPRITEIAQDMISRAGIKVEITVFESATLLARTPEGVHDAILIQYGSADPNVLHTFLHSSRLEAANRVHYVSPRADVLLERQRTIVDLDERFNVLRELQEILMEEIPWVPIYTPITYVGVRKEVQGFQVSPIGGWRIHDAYKMVPAGE